MAWQKSTRCESQHCVEVDINPNRELVGAGVGAAVIGSEVLVRDAKDPGGGVLAFSPNAWRGFTANIPQRPAIEPAAPQPVYALVG